MVESTPKWQSPHKRGGHSPYPDFEAFAAAVLDALHQLRRGQDEIRRQIAGHAKSHLTVEELADLVGRAPYTIREWIKDGRVNAIRVTGSGPRGRLLIPREEVTKLIDAGMGANVPAAATR